MLREDSLPCRELSIRIDVSKSIVSREVRRNGTAGGYSVAETFPRASTRYHGCPTFFMLSG
ncbi:hypothetical protein LGE20_002798 [Salmonella enterica]|nr:hypothetical protein [Salmonella enterica]HBJ6313528.1 hypothetical protein [Salmonella enterica subsp. diarizonae serovar 50:r:z]EIG9535239.1 hypothetical protein [Salmonella enterica]EIH0807525.1 hypothetical protein [Salmonella enterica]EIH2226241.1 hypothetical protein [Salmonella enterica]